MATSKPTSTISYNSKEFLLEKLNEWYDAHIIQAYQLIKHKGEDGDKDHFHVRIEPNKRIDTMVLQAELREYVPDNDKPLGCRPFRPSKEEDWFLYALHDPEYLKIHNSDSKDGKIRYKPEDIIVSEYYDKDVAILRARQSLENSSASIIKQIKEGRVAQELIEEGKDVFKTKAILQLLHATDYETIVQQYHDLEHEYDMMKQAIFDYGLELVPDPVDENKCFLRPI